MASTTWILSFCMLLSAVPFITGIEFTFNRALGRDICANLVCSHDAGQQQSGKFAIRKITVYAVGEKTKFPLVYRVVGENDMFVDPTKLHDVNGTSAITKYHAELHLNFHNPTDCMYRTFLCEAEYVDASGKKQVVRKTIAPTTPNVNDDCSCSSITFRLDKLNNTARGATRQVYGLKLNLENMQIAVESIQNVTSNIAERIASLRESHENIRGATVELRERDREIEVEMNGVRDKETLLESSLDDVAQSQQDSQELIETLNDKDKIIDKRFRDFDRLERAQSDSLSSLKRFDAGVEDVLSNLEKVNNDHEQRESNLRNESSSLANQIGELGENDNRLRASAGAVSAQQAQLQTSVAAAKSTDTSIDKGLAATDSSDRELQEDAAQIQRANVAKEGEINEISVSYSELEADGRELEKSDVSIDVIIEGLEKQDEEINALLEALGATDAILKQSLNGLVATYRVHQEQVDSIRKTDTTQRLDIADLNVKDQITRQQINEIKSNNSEFASGINVIQIQQGDISALIDSCMNNLLVIENQVTTAQVTTESKTTASLVLSSCTRNMPHDNPRAAIVLDGGHSTVCDTVTGGGGYVLAASRTIGNEDFDRSWEEYKDGFGSPASGDFYVGNGFLEKYTALGYNDMRIDMRDKYGNSFYAQYNVRVEGEDSKFRLHVSDYQGTAGDSLRVHDGMPFSTYDRDYDASNDNCARAHGGGFWYNNCGDASLFGAWGVDVIWSTISKTESLASVEVKIRKVE